MSELEIDYGDGGADSDQDERISLGGFEDTPAEVAPVEVAAPAEAAVPVASSAPQQAAEPVQDGPKPQLGLIGNTDWIAKESKSFGGIYYANVKDNRTLWDKPDEVIAYEASLEAAAVELPAPVAELKEAPPARSERVERDDRGRQDRAPERSPRGDRRPPDDRYRGDDRRRDRDPRAREPLRGHDGRGDERRGDGRRDGPRDDDRDPRRNRITKTFPEDTINTRREAESYRPGGGSADVSSAAPPAQPARRALSPARRPRSPPPHGRRSPPPRRRSPPAYTVRRGADSYIPGAAGPPRSPPRHGGEQRYGSEQVNGRRARSPPPPSSNRPRSRSPPRRQQSDGDRRARDRDVTPRYDEPAPAKREEPLARNERDDGRRQQEPPPPLPADPVAAQAYGRRNRQDAPREPERPRREPELRTDAERRAELQRRLDRERESRVSPPEPNGPAAENEPPRSMMVNPARMAAVLRAEEDARRLAGGGNYSESSMLSGRDQAPRERDQAPRDREARDRDSRDRDPPSRDHRRSSISEKSAPPPHASRGNELAPRDAPSGPRVPTSKLTIPPSGPKGGRRPPATPGSARDDFAPPLSAASQSGRGSGGRNPFGLSPSTPASGGLPTGPRRSGGYDSYRPEPASARDNGPNEPRRPQDDRDAQRPPLTSRQSGSADFENRNRRLSDQMQVDTEASRSRPRDEDAAVADADRPSKRRRDDEADAPARQTSTQEAPRSPTTPPPRSAEPSTPPPPSASGPASGGASLLSRLEAAPSINLKGRASQGGRAGDNSGAEDDQAIDVDAERSEGPMPARRGRGRRNRRGQK